MSRSARFGLLAGIAVLALAPLWGPPVLREIPWFRVRRVEISGTRLLAPHQVLAASRIRAGQNLWDDLGVLERALRAHPAIAGSTISRKLPGTLRIRVEEKRPIAYVELGALAPVTAQGEVLPIDPVRAGMDLPVIRGAWGTVAPRLRARILAETERLGRADPALLAHVSEIRSIDAKFEVLVLSHSLADIILPVGAGVARLAQLRAVLGDLERRLPPADPLHGPLPAARVDLRYGEQIVVRIPSSV